jgi:hypothetical protein
MTQSNYLDIVFLQQKSQQLAGLRYRGVAILWGKSGESPALSRNGKANESQARMPTCEDGLIPSRERGDSHEHEDASRLCFA